MLNLITDIAGIRVGHAHDGRLLSGATAILFDEPAVASVADDILARAKALGLAARVIGRTGGNALVLPGESALTLAVLEAAHQGWLPGYMALRAV